MSKHQGLHTHRFHDNPEENRFAEAWEKENEQGHILAHLLDRSRGTLNAGRPAEPSDEASTIGATVIQWLGSPVGQGFLRELGYERGSPQDTEILWAAMTAMVKDIHAPQDQLTKAQWERADAMMARLDREMERK